MRSKLAIAIVFVLRLNLVGCSSSERVLTEEELRNAICLNLEEPEDVRSVAKWVPFGVIISPKLSAAMREYPDDTVFRIGICFQAMVSESELEELSYNEKNEYLNDVAERASECCREEGMIAYMGGGASYDWRFFYAFGTEEQIRNLSKHLDVRLYAFATVLYK